MNLPEKMHISFVITLEGRCAPCVCMCLATSMPVVVAYIVANMPYALQQAVLTDCLFYSHQAPKHEELSSISMQVLNSK